jgi:hypothetical protein
MTHPSYESLIEDHLEIEALGDAILQEIGRDVSDVTEIERIMAQLAALVDTHVAAEGNLVVQLDHTMADSPWLGWEACQRDFDTLRRDWDGFLHDWTADNIRRDFDGFCADARRVLGHLNDRVRKESDVLYAGALQKTLIPLIQNRDAAS